MKGTRNLTRVKSPKFFEKKRREELERFENATEPNELTWQARER